MNLETLRNLDKKYAQVIANYLLNRIETDECLKTKLEETNKTLKGCVEYIKEEARKEAEDNVAIIEDSQVYEWAVHYFLEDSLDCELKAKSSKNKNNDEELEDEVVKEKKQSTPKVAKPKKDIKEKLDEQLSVFDLL